MGIISLVRGVGYAIGPWFVSVMFQNYFESPFILWSILASFGLAASVGYYLLGVLASKKANWNSDFDEIIDVV
ncbi:MAG: hypothetical protein GY750_04015 [Lentisphaerae bacterium]|nr:hypothetical protein [Lentisphaerota bacterium]MCP4100579.1 hypothetical protein [Lentisphaerota bacterium]